MTSIAAKGASALATLFLIVVPIWASPNISDLAHQCNSLGKQNACRELAEIALEVGFADQSHFARCFNRILGQTPSSFRHQKGSV